MTEPKAAPKSRKKKLLLFLVVVLTLEGLLRLVAGNMQIAPYAFHLEDGRCIGLQPNRSLTYTGWLWRIDPVTHDTNSYGFRGPDRPPAKAPGTFRIAALGDSFIYGQGVNTPDTLPAQLERALQEERPQIEVLNFGVPGYGMEEYLLQYERFITRWSPDLLLLFLHESDMIDRMCEQVPPEAKSEGDGQMPSYVLRAGFMVVKIAGNIAGRLTGHSERADLSARFGEIMIALKQQTEALQTRLAVVVIGDPLRDKEALSDLLWLHKIPALTDGDPVWQLERIPGETHFTAKGLGELSTLTQNFLKREGLLPPAP